MYEFHSTPQSTFSPRRDAEEHLLINELEFLELTKQVLSEKIEMENEIASIRLLSVCAEFEKREDSFHAYFDHHDTGVEQGDSPAEDDDDRCVRLHDFTSWLVRQQQVFKIWFTRAPFPFI